MGPSRFLVLEFGVLLAFISTSDSTILLDCGQSGRPVCKGVVELKMSCSTKTQDQGKDRRGGTLRWVENKNDELAYFDNESEINSSVTKRNIVFTLQDRYEPQAGRHIYCSTAVGNKITESLRIGCSDGTDAKYCHISVIDVPRPSWRENSHSICQFDRNKVDLFWIPPSIGGKCCINYLVKEAGEDKLITNTSNTTTSLSYRDLAMGKHKYTVQCVDTADVLSPPSVPLHIYPEVRLKFVSVRPAIDNDYEKRVKYDVTWKTQKSKTLRDKIICTPPVTEVTFSCNSSGSRVCEISKPVTNRTAYCIVRRNETITAAVTITNEIGRLDTKTDTADYLANVYQELQNCTGEKEWYMGYLPSTIVFVALFVIVLFIIIPGSIFLFYLKKNRSKFCK